MKRILLILVALMLVFPSVSHMAKDRYIWFDGNDNYDCYFDSQTVHFFKDSDYRQIDSNYVEIWVKFVYNENGVANVIKELERDGKSTYGYNDFSYTMYNWQYNLRENKIREIRMLDYDSKGNVLTDYTFPSYEPPGQWYSIIPDTHSENGRRAIKSWISSNMDDILKRSR